jgi:hypothetical protein
VYSALRFVQSPTLSARIAVVIAFDLLRLVVVYVLTLLTTMPVGLSDRGLAMRGIAEQRLSMTALLASDDEIPMEEFAVG